MQRVIGNQNEVVKYLKDECAKMGVDLIFADFYGEKKDTPFQEQAQFVSSANIMIGMHGAGLNMFHFLPFNSIVIEIHSGTSAQKNSANYVNYVREGKYISMNADIQGTKRTLNVKPIWETLKNAIHEWERM